MTEKEGTERAARRRAEFALAPLRKFEIAGLDGSIYLTRHHLLENPDGSQVMLHQIHRSDEDREFHDHPWAFRSFIAAGAYIEHTPVFREGSRAWIPGESRQRLYRAGEWNDRPDPASVHRVEVVEHPCISVVYRGPRVRDWGFLMPDGTWVPHQDYLRVKHGFRFDGMETADA